jgi:hypothetical protein
MPTLLHHSETTGAGVTIRLDSGEPCVISVAQTGVRVKKSRFGFLGPTLFEERDVYQAARTGMALAELFPDFKLPVTIKNPVLSAFANAAWHCSSAAAVSVTLGKARDELRGK